MKLRLPSSFARTLVSAAVIATTATAFAACSADGDLDLGLDADASSPDAAMADGSAPPRPDADPPPTSSPKLCGNKKLDQGEECDDGNTANNDGCSAACKIEAAAPEDVCTGVAITLTKEDASTLYTGSVSGSTKGLFNHYAATCGGGSGPDAVYRIDPPMTGRATVRITAGFSAVLSARTGCTDAKTELGCADDSAASPDAGTGTSLAFPVFQGAPVFVFVDGYGGSGGAFTLDVDVQTAVCGNGKAEFPEACDDGNTDDGDGCSSTCTLDDTTSASACPGIGYRLGANAANPGLVSFAGDTTSLSNTNGSASGCSSTGSGPNAVYAITPTVTGNLSLSLLANYANALLHVRRECNDNTTQADCSGASDALVPLKTSIPVNAEQTVYVFVDSGSSSAKGLYTLDAKLTVSACGNGLLDTGEECDDANTNDGDGCSSSCSVERNPSTYTCPGQPLRLEGAAAGPRSISVRGTNAPLAGQSVPANKWSTCGVSTAPDVVYQVTSDIDGWATARVKGVFNSALAVRTACPGTADVACAKASGGWGEEVLQFAMNKETPYFLVVDGATAGQQGSFTLDVDIVPSVCGNSVIEGGETCDDGATDNGDGCDVSCKLETDKARDKCPTAPPITLAENGDGTWGATVVSGTTGLVHDTGVTSTHTLSPCSSNGPDAFFAITPPLSGVMTASIPFATFRTSIGARTACPTAGTQLACDAAASDGGQEITFAVTQGVTYYLIVDGQNVTGRPNFGRFTMDVKVVPTGCGDTFLNPPEQCEDGNTASGDGCSSTCTLETLAGIGACPGHAVSLTGTGTDPRRATVTVDTTNLPSNTGGICGGSGPEGVLVITPDIDGQLSIKGTASHGVALYMRTTCNDPSTEISQGSCSSTSALSAPVKKNTPYYVYVDGLNGAAGVTKLQVTVTP